MGHNLCAGLQYMNSFFLSGFMANALVISCAVMPTVSWLSVALFHHEQLVTGLSPCHRPCNGTNNGPFPPFDH